MIDLKVVQSIPKFVGTYITAFSIGMIVGMYKGCEAGYDNGYRQAVYDIHQEKDPQARDGLEEVIDSLTSP